MRHVIPLALLWLSACGEKTEDTATGPTGSPTETTPAATDGSCDDPAVNPFAGSCVETFFADCFDPAGACTYTAAGLDSTITWDNGATVEVQAGIQTTTTLTASDGTECATALTEVMQGDCVAQTTYRRASDGALQVWCTYQDGSYDVTCEDGTKISVTADQSQDAGTCAYGGDQTCTQAG